MKLNLKFNNILFMFIVLVLTSCGCWNYKNIKYERSQYIEKIHVHLYYHDSCEWHCLNMEEGVYTFEDQFIIKYKTNKKGKIKKVKLVK